VASNEAAWASSENWVKQQGLSAEHRDYHDLHWSIYGSLQQGRYARASALVDDFRRMAAAIPPESRHFLQDAIAIAANVVETRQWDEADPLFAGLAAATAPSPTGTRQIEICCASPASARIVIGGADVPMFIGALAMTARRAPDAPERAEALRAAAKA
jgi:hypothetical protein